MLKPEEIKNITFEQSVFSGYKKEDVDAFLDKVYAEYSRVFKENAELVGKLKVCVNKIEEYREDEKFLKSAIVNAQKLNETAVQEIAVKKKETEEAARKQADEIITEAKERAAKMIADSNAKIAAFREKTTSEFSLKQQENARLLEEQKADIDAQIEAKKEALAAIEAKIDTYTATVLNIFDNAKALLTDIPQPIAKATIMPQQEPVLAVETVEEEIIEPETLAEEVIEPLEEVEISETEFEETEFEAPKEADEVLNEDQAESIEEANAVPDFEQPEEIEISAPVEEEQISIDEVIATNVSPVEPAAPIFTPDDDEEEEEEDGFSLFGGAPLIFPQDIPEDDEEPQVKETKEKGSRFKKRLKFGTDFDIKNDK